jgi:molybdopterin molybdotransferase
MQVREALRLRIVDLAPGAPGQPQPSRGPRGMNAAFPQRLAFAQAQEIVAAVAAAARLDIERRPLTRALGAVLAEDLAAAIALPGFDNSAMDGFAVRSADGLAPRRLVGEQFAGAERGPAHRSRRMRAHHHRRDPAAGRRRDRDEGERDRRRGTITPTQAPKPGQHVRRRGEDVQPGDVVLRAGTRLGPSHVSLAAALGAHDLPVRRRPTVAVFTTGDELRAPGQALAPGEIHDSNRPLLQSLLLAEGLEPVAWPVLPDEPPRSRRRWPTPRFPSTW